MAKGNGNGGGGGWVALGLLLAFLAGAAIASTQTRRETVPCPKCSKPVPIKAPICPWCRKPIFWK